MGQAKKEQMEQEAKLARRDSFLINNTSYQNQNITFFGTNIFRYFK